MFRLPIDEQVSLCVCMPEMAQPLFALIDAERHWLNQWLPWPSEIQTPVDALAMIRQHLQLLAEREMLALCILYEGQLAGCIHLQQVDWRIQTGRIGYWLAQDYQGKGIMQRALQALLSLAFSQWQLERIEIRVASDNHPSRKVIERAGFIHEGRIRHAERLHDRIVDHEIFGMMREEWQSLPH